MPVRPKHLSAPPPPTTPVVKPAPSLVVTAPVVARKSDAWSNAATTAPESKADIAEAVKHFAARNVFDQVMSLDLNRDGELDHSDVTAAAKAGIAFSVDVTLSNGNVEHLSGPERLAHAADVLATALRTNTAVDESQLLEPAGAALTRGIAESWPALVRRSNNVPDLVAALKVSNLPAPDGKLHVWVPVTDQRALERLKTEAKVYAAEHPNEPPLVVETFTEGMDWRELDAHKPGILYLPEAFVVPGGRFSEMYGWDSYFIGQGLISSGRTDLARSMVENQVYLLENFGKIPNSSRSYHLSRSQPPFLPRLALELYQAEPTPQHLALLKNVAAAAEKELATVWGAPGQKTESGLSRFHDDASGVDLEVERNLTSQGVFSWPDPEADRAARATGWDLSHRFSDHAQHFEPVDLNSQLFQYEKDLAQIYRLVEGEASGPAKVHEAGAAHRAEVMQSRMWNEELGLFVDHDNQAGKPSSYESLATFAPLAAGWASPEQARRVAENLPKFLEQGGLATSSRASREAAGEEALQWDWPNGWAPLQVIAVEGLAKYGFTKEANEVAYRWCAALLDIAGSNNGLLPEKIDVHAVSADVASAEYGNQGADRGSYWTPREENPQGFGWTNASFVKLRDLLPPELKAALDQGVKPDALF